MFCYRSMRLSSKGQKMAFLFFVTINVARNKPSPWLYLVNGAFFLVNIFSEVKLAVQFLQNELLI
jgi:hypothetical protein